MIRNMIYVLKHELLYCKTYNFAGVVKDKFQPWLIIKMYCIASVFPN